MLVKKKERIKKPPKKKRREKRTKLLETFANTNLLCYRYFFLLFLAPLYASLVKQKREIIAFRSYENSHFRSFRESENILTRFS